MKKIEFISNISFEDFDGGGSAVNHATIIQLKKEFKTGVIHIDEGYDIMAKLKSKILHLIGKKRNYHFFSNKRLNRIRDTYKSTISNEADAYFFHGFTSWINIKPNKPYYCFGDASFVTYVRIYNSLDQFDSKDLNEIYRKEADWLNKAEKVFFRSEWALNETKNKYKLNGKNFFSVGVGGFIPNPINDIFNGDLNFLFIAKEFEPKGGKIAVEAFRLVKEKFPNAKLNIIGAAPDKDTILFAGIEYIGYLNKKNVSELKKMSEIYSQSFALIHPTIKDINPLVIYELAYYGCPAIATNDFAIPELIDNEKTGLLLENPRDSRELAEKMLYFINNPSLYKQLRVQARIKVNSQGTWDKVGEKLRSHIMESLNK